MSLWFRAYCDALDNPKIQLLEPELFKAWFNLMALAKMNNGRIASVSLVAFRLRVDFVTARRYLDLLSSPETRLLDLQSDGSWTPHDWEHWQYESDKSALRMKRHRSKIASVTVTKDDRHSDGACDGHVTVDVTPSDGKCDVPEQSRAEQIQSRTEQSLPAAKAEPKPPSPLDVAIQETAGRIYARHPERRRDCSKGAVVSKLGAILRHQRKGYPEAAKIQYVSEIDSNHAAKCMSADWQKDGGEFAKALEGWLAPTMERYASGPGSGAVQMPIEKWPGQLSGRPNPGLVGEDRW